MKKEQKLIPQLRFPEFEDNWRTEELDSYIKLLSGYAFKGDDISETNKGIRLLRGINITEGRIRHRKDIDRYYNKTVVGLEKYLLQEDDLVLGMDGSKVGKNVSLISKEDVGSLLIQRVARIRAKDSTDIRFIYLNIFSERFHKYVDKVNTSSGIPHISSKQIKEFSIGFPSLPEQQKIASFLTAVDDKITQLTKKKTLLEQYKKGVMQKIFNQELRFKPNVIARTKDEAISPKETNFPDWEEKKLGEVCEKIQDGNYGASYPKSNEFVETGIPFLTSKALGGGGSIISEKIDYIPKEKHQELKKAQLKIKDVLFTNRGANVGAVALVDKTIAHGNIGPQLTLLRVEKDIATSEFLLQSMNCFSVRKQISSQDSGSAMNFFGIGATSKFKIQIPTIEEQTKIANFLSAIDVKIEALNTKIENSKTFKKGLLQQLFV